MIAHWRPRNEAHLQAILRVVDLAPRVCVHLSADHDDHAAATREAADALRAGAAAYRLPPGEVDLPDEEARRLLATYDLVWWLIRALEALARCPPMRRRESRAVTEERQRWALRVRRLHLELEGRT